MPGPELDFEAQLCSAHREPFRALYPKGVPVAMVLAFEAFLAQPDVRLWLGTAPSEVKLQLSIGEWGPLCCALPIELWEEIVEVSIRGDLDAKKELSGRIRALSL